MQKAEYPQRECRQPVHVNEHITHFCDGPELHPGPCAPSTHRESLERRAAWEAANPGWEKLAADPDPFREAGTIVPEERP